MNSFSWIDEYVNGVVDLYSSDDVYEIYSILGINIIRLDKANELLQECEAVYIRNYFDVEVVFIRDDLPYKYEKFILAHELGHALLHTELSKATYNRNLINKGKLERQANYFALRLLDITIDKVCYEDYTYGQLASELCVTEDSLKYCFI